jgi:hypothetical protein
MVQLSQLVSEGVAGARQASLSTMGEIGKAAKGVGNKAIGVGNKATHLLLPRRAKSRPGRNHSSGDMNRINNNDENTGEQQERIIPQLQLENVWLRRRILELETKLRDVETDLETQRKLAGGLSRLRASNVTIGKQVGEGAFGAVYRGQWRGVTCALKFVQQSVADTLTKEFSILDQFDHANIVQLYGIVEPEADGHVPSSWSRDLQPPCLVMEYMGYELPGDETHPPVKVRDFIDFLKRTKYLRKDPEYWIRLCGMLAGATRGLAYLHSHGFMHRDVKGVNLLLDSRGTLKLADFGLATLFVKPARLATSGPKASTYRKGPITHPLSPSWSLLNNGLTTAAGTYTHSKFDS